MIAAWGRPSGFYIERVRVPLGVIGIIHEVRGNVIADAGGLCFKAGAAILAAPRASNPRLASSPASMRGREAEMAIQLVLTTDRTAVGRLLSMSNLTDMTSVLSRIYPVRLMCDVFAGRLLCLARATGGRAGNRQYQVAGRGDPAGLSGKWQTLQQVRWSVPRCGRRDPTRIQARQKKMASLPGPLVIVQGAGPSVSPSGQSRSASTRPQAGEMRA